MTDERRLRDRRLRLQFSCEVLFSIYFSAALLVSEESRDWSWATQIRVWYFSYFYPQSPHAIDSPYFERKIEFLLAWVIATIAFVVLRSLYRIPNARALLRWLIGLVALIGMPATLLWTGFGNRVLLLFSIGLGVAIASLYVFATRHSVSWLKLLIIACYFILTTWLAWRSWITLPLGLFALLPSLDWVPGTYPVAKNAFPLLGFMLAETWVLWTNSIQTPTPTRNLAETL
jgi:hypothetical protein